MTITQDDVRRSVDRARAGLVAAAEEVIWQIENQTWLVLGYASWDQMRDTEYGGAAFMVPTQARTQLVQRLRALGMTQQQIADTAGVTQGQVSRDMHMHKPKPRPTRPGITSWSRRVQRVSTSCPMDDDGSATRTQRPVTSHSLGAKARYVAAVGALADADAE